MQNKNFMFGVLLMPVLYLRYFLLTFISSFVIIVCISNIVYTFVGILLASLFLGLCVCFLYYYFFHDLGGLNGLLKWLIKSLDFDYIITEGKRETNDIWVDINIVVGNKTFDTKYIVDRYLYSKYDLEIYRKIILMYLFK